MTEQHVCKKSRLENSSMGILDRFADIIKANITTRWTRQTIQAAAPAVESATPKLNA